MAYRNKSVIVTSLMALSLAACGQKAEPPKKDEPPALPAPKTGDAIDAAAEEAMLAAEESTDAKVDAAEDKKPAVVKSNDKAEKAGETSDQR
jgi:hypothetical protein